MICHALPCTAMRFHAMQLDWKKGEFREDNSRACLVGFFETTKWWLADRYSANGIRDEWGGSLHIQTLLR